MSTKQTETAPSFLQVYTQVRRDRMKHSFLRQITACVDWRGIRTLLNKKYTKTHNAIGNPAYDALMMFKILLLQTWYGLSDYEVEERINASILFSEFLVLDMGLPAPDHSTISRFRTELTRLGIMDKLLRELNKQFKKHGISRIDQGAIVDASIVDSPYAPDGSIRRWFMGGRCRYRGLERTHTQNVLEAMWHTISNVCRDCLCFKASNKRKTSGFGSVKLPKSGKGEVWRWLHLP